ncbi:hypothetical protein WJX74_004763 [Apatococcus lobatus]|uniref:Chloride channel protein n=1 Tax=Apatococcus lobatus TaxID=904363 RepID=A0AAW1Q610_9CHLO
MACCLVQFYAPAAAGGGVSLVMAYLNGNDVPDLLRGRTLIVKWLGTMCGVTAGLAVGPEAPMVHMGACVASLLAFLDFGAVFSDKGKMKREGVSSDTPEAVAVPWHSDADHREFVSAGSAAGIAAAFGAPIGGVLFSLEEACTHWSRRVLWRCFLAAAVATFTLAQVHPRWQGGMLSFESRGRDKVMENNDWAVQLAFFIAVSVAGGLLGAAFSGLRKCLWRVRVSRAQNGLRIVEVIGVGLITISCIFLLSYGLGRCIRVPDQWQDENGVKYGARLNCPSGQYNDVATVYLSVPAETIKRMFSLSVSVDESSEGPEDFWACSDVNACRFTPRSLGIIALSTPVLMALASGLSIPGGLFMPSIMTGAAFGGMVGMHLIQILPPWWNIQPGVYALVASSAVLGGVFRSAISLVVIVVEGTSGIDFLFGIILAVVVGNWIAGHLPGGKEGAYASELQREGGVTFLRPEAPRALQHLSAADLMATEVITFQPFESLDRVVDILRSTPHNGFPVVSQQRAAGGGSGRQQLEGLVLRSQLLVLLQSRAVCDDQGRFLQSSAEEYEHAEAGGRRRASLDARMRSFFTRPRFRYRRSLASKPEVLDALGYPSLQPTSSSADGSSASTAQNGFSAQQADTRGSSTPPLERIPESRVSLGHGITVLGPAFGSANGVHSNGNPNPEVALPGDLFLDLRPFMSLTPLAIRQETAASRAHQIFAKLGLRHLCVTDQHNQLVGLITRKDLTCADKQPSGGQDSNSYQPLLSGHAHQRNGRRHSGSQETCTSPMNVQPALNHALLSIASSPSTAPQSLYRTSCQASLHASGTILEADSSSDSPRDSSDEAASNDHGRQDHDSAK